MSEVSIVAIIAAVMAAIPPTLVAFGAFRQAKRATDKADVIINKATEIHTLTNGSLHTITAALAVANEKILGLEKVILTMQEPKAESAPKETK